MIASDFWESASLVVATLERRFLKDGGGVLVLHPETGAEMRRIAATAGPSQQCLWLLVSDAILVTLTGPAQKDSADADDYRPNDVKARAQGEVNELYVGQELAAWDAASGAELCTVQRESLRKLLKHSETCRDTRCCSASTIPRVTIQARRS